MVVMMVVAMPPDHDHMVMMVMVMADPHAMMMVVMMPLHQLHPRLPFGPRLVVRLQHFGRVRHRAEQLGVGVCLRQGLRPSDGRHRRRGGKNSGYSFIHVRFSEKADCLRSGKCGLGPKFHL